MEYLISGNYFRDDLDDRQVMVTINCIAYNQADYIRQTLEGFVSQQTNFRFEAVVHDDASTDATAEIIREFAEKYPSIIKPIFETENQYSKANGSLAQVMRPHIRGKYVAYCEGDDYWTDPLKLQKQVDFMERNPDYSLICSNADFYIQNENRLNKCVYKHSGTFGIEHLIIHDVIETCTVMLRRDLLNQYRKELTDKFSNLSFGDYPLWLYMSTKGKCMRLKDVTGVYRINSGGVSNLTDKCKKIKWMRSLIFVIDYFSTKYSIEDEAVNRSYFIFFRHWAFFAAENDIEIFERSVTFYKENGYFWTAQFLNCFRRLRYPKSLWRFINAHNRIKPVITKSYNPQ